MLFGINISLILSIALPPIAYAFIVYLTSPHKSISFRTSLQYLLAGISSTILVSFIMLVSPSNGVDVLLPFTQSFFDIAPREEFAKFALFFLMGNMRKNLTEYNDHPIGTMFYMSMIGLGFATFENIQYIGVFGHGILPLRLVTTTIAHMLFGMFAGYWIALGRINTGKYGNRSVFGLLMAKYPQLKQMIYILIGWLAAVGYHGLWNYNLLLTKGVYSVNNDGLTHFVDDVSSSPIMIMLIFFGLVGAKFATKDLNDNYRRKLKSL